ncbi:MAG: transporter substrate-binding domain-containing protein [Thiogranum sp.]
MSSLLTSARIRWFTLPALLITLAGPAVATARADDNLHEQLSVAEKFTGDLPEMRKRKRIRALVTYSKTDFFFHQGGARGVQAEFLREYEKFLNKGVKRAEDRIHITFLPVRFSELLPALQQGKGDIAAAFLTITPQREKEVNFASGGKLKVGELVVTNKAVKPLENIEDLAGKTVYVLNQSSYVEHLRHLNETFRQKKLAPIRIEQADPNLLSEDILELVNSGVVAITVVDDYKARLWEQVLPDIRVHENLKVTEANTIGWATRKDNKALIRSLNAFALKIRKGTLLGNMLFKRYYRDTGWINNPVSKEELRKLEAFVALFRKYAERYDFDHLALLAQAYQESGLDHSKKSHRGAVGIMQLLPSTAGDPNVNIGNIRNLENNIHAGTKYLAFIRDRYFNDAAINTENRLALTWAAYNAGPARVQKMRDKAKKMGLDPDIWFSNVELAAGKMTGRETVQYVANIYKYYVAYKLASQVTNTDTVPISGAR